MELRRSYTDLGPIPSASLPDLRPWDREALTRPGRREGTARIRREWEAHKRHVQPKASELAWLKEYARYIHRRKYHHDDDSCSNNNNNRPEVCQRKMNIDKAVFRDILRAQVFKRNVPERLPYVTSVRAVTAPQRKPLAACNHSPVTLFQQASGHVQHVKEKDKRPMHFINKEWGSEKVSWLRFHTTLGECHKRSWIE